MPTERTPSTVVHRYYEYADDGAIEALVSLFAPDVIYDRPGHPRIEGRRALERFYRHVRPFSDGSHELHTVLADEDEIATRGTFRGSRDGDRIRVGFADFFRFDDEIQVESQDTYMDGNWV